MKQKILRKAKLYWGRAANAREQAAIARAGGPDEIKWTELAEEYARISRELFDSLPSSKTKALNIAK